MQKGKQFFLNAGDKLRNREFTSLIKLFDKNKKIYGTNFVLWNSYLYERLSRF